MAAIMMILTPTLGMIVAVILWGLKLEQELNEERLRHDYAIREMQQLSREFHAWIGDHDNNYPPPWLLERIDRLDNDIKQHQH